MLPSTNIEMFGHPEALTGKSETRWVLTFSCTVAVMRTITHTFTTALWEMPTTAAAWVFVTLPAEASEAIRSTPRPPRPGFGSIRVRATVGASTWATSIFPDSTTGCYVLPVKKAVRAAEGIELGDTVGVTVEVLE